MHAKAGKRMVYAVPLIVFMDDVSANISKQWNKHHVIYISNANMPREMIEKQFCIRFVSSSPHAAPMELMRGFKESLTYAFFFLYSRRLRSLTTYSEAAENGVVTWDCKNNEEVLLCPYGLFWGADNPMQAEECSHGGLACNYFCRTCKVGGTKEWKSSDEGFQSLFSVSLYNW